MNHAVTVDPLVVQEALDEMTTGSLVQDLQRAFAALESATHRAVEARARALRIETRYRSMVGNRIPCVAKALPDGGWIVWRSKNDPVPPRCWKCQLCWEFACELARDADDLRLAAHDHAVEIVIRLEDSSDDITGIARATARGRASAEDRRGPIGGYHD